MDIRSSETTVLPYKFNYLETCTLSMSSPVYLHLLLECLSKSPEINSIATGRYQQSQAIGIT